MQAPGESFKISGFFFFFFSFFFFFLFFFHYLLKIMCVYFLPFKNIFKASRKEKKNHYKEITVSCQFSIRKIGNFGTDQLRDIGRIQW